MCQIVGGSIIVLEGRILSMHLSRHNRECAILRPQCFADVIPYLVGPECYALMVMEPDAGGGAVVQQR